MSVTPPSNPQNAKLALAVAAGAVAVSLAVMGLNREPAGADIVAASNPVAAVAWAQANCYRGLVLKEPGALTQSDVLLEVAASFESKRYNEGIKAACDKALRLGKRVIEPSTIPSFSGEPPRYDDQAEVAAVR